MEMLLATQSSTPIIGQVAVFLGWIMNAIYKCLDLIGIQNLGICIIIFSIIVYALMTPLQIKQQKFSKLSSVMQPELQKIQKKYQNKKDQASMQKMQEETQAVYAKYGVSPTGSCVQLLIQMPILLSLWQVIYNIPAYVGSVKEVFTEAVNHIIQVEGFTELIQNFITDNKITRVQLALEEGVAKSNSVIDFLYALSPAQWVKLGEMPEFAAFTDVIEKTAEEISAMQGFVGLNIAEQPLNYITNMFSGGSVLIGILALLIPILSWATQVLDYKIMPQATQQADDPNNAMNSSMKTMNTVMPVMSAVFCFTFPVGLGIYWIASALVRTVQQIIINKKLDSIDMDELVNENMKKLEKKREKEGLPPQKITNQAHQSVKNINKIDKGNSGTNAAERAKKVEEAYQKSKNAKPGSIAAKANMVRDYNERNKK